MTCRPISRDYRSALNQQSVPGNFRRARIKLSENKVLLSSKIQRIPSCSGNKGHSDKPGSRTRNNPIWFITSRMQYIHSKCINDSINWNLISPSLNSHVHFLLFLINWNGGKYSHYNFFSKNWLRGLDYMNKMGKL